MRKTLAALCLLAGPALAQAPDLRPPDVLRMRALDAHLGAALREAIAEGDPQALAVLFEAMRGAPVALDDADPEGVWNCRTIKLGGGGVPAVAYRNFRCEIRTVTDGRWVLTKLTGSQRTTGTLAVRADGRIQYTGVGHVGTEPAVPYEDLPPKDQTPLEPNQTTADVGLFEMMSPDRARLLQPAPILESRFDILYLTR
ncbi:DUF4893 domain-containing protein [Jannaschia marina]|uniref:DUF4893 domain-containing protein n=1 Tax=Jannaschia marina TaxID=2741674 RepID=UPI0015CA37B3|nr:DUF4893 domain-containing protein [Jannaschia marina]